MNWTVAWSSWPGVPVWGRGSGYKQRHHVPVVARQREDVMLDRVARLAKEEGLDPRVVQQVPRNGDRRLHASPGGGAPSR